MRIYPLCGEEMFLVKEKCKYLLFYTFNMTLALITLKAVPQQSMSE